jgi:hypothetical protein
MKEKKERNGTDLVTFVHHRSIGFFSLASISFFLLFFVKLPTDASHEERKKRNTRRLDSIETAGGTGPTRPAGGLTRAIDANAQLGESGEIDNGRRRRSRPRPFLCLPAIG